MSEHLWDEMEKAADILERASEIYYKGRNVGRDADHIDWRPVNLRTVAQDWRDEYERKLVRQELSSIINHQPDTAKLVDSIMEHFNVTRIDRARR